MWKNPSFSNSTCCTFGTFKDENKRLKLNTNKK